MRWVPGPGSQGPKVLGPGVLFPVLHHVKTYHGTIIRTGILCEKIPCYTHNSTRQYKYIAFNIFLFRILIISCKMLTIYVLVIARYRVEYGQYFPSSKIFCRKSLNEENASILYEELCDNLFIVNILFFICKSSYNVKDIDVTKNVVTMVVIASKTSKSYVINQFHFQRSNFRIL